MSATATRVELVHCLYCNKTHAAERGEDPCGGRPENWVVDSTGTTWARHWEAVDWVANLPLLKDTP